MFCGNKKYCGDGERPEDNLKPVLIDSLLREDIIDIGCGDEHAVAVAYGGKVYVWGNGANGRLGTGSTSFVTTAVPVVDVLSISFNYYVPKLFQGIITDALTLTAIKGFPSRVVDTLACGDGFSLAGTADNELYFWGSRCQQPWSRLTVDDLEALDPSTDFEKLESNDDDDTFISLADLVSSKRNVIVVIETSFPNERKQLSKRLNNSLPQATGLEDSQVETWIQRELDDAEYLPKTYSGKSTTNANGTNVTSNNTSMDKTKLDERQLLEEIEKLKEKISDQSRTCKEHESQMQDLKNKLTELQQLQTRQQYHEPPPEYSESKGFLLRNNMFSRVQSRTCVLL
ncbi:unnamed protein product [Gongylonema pulchrum]|uniref:non-specific serine/threonine protein kinase n=1 Tax=Gongylonema pulchrum TaxID=637853 RepID=A0A183CUN5_9BILA|nr:unnamed protein product [Gongylonema pulchrum]